MNPRDVFADVLTAARTAAVCRGKTQVRRPSVCLAHTRADSPGGSTDVQEQRQRVASVVACGGGDAQSSQQHHQRVATATVFVGTAPVDRHGGVVRRRRRRRAAEARGEHLLGNVRRAPATCRASRSAASTRSTSTTDRCWRPALANTATATAPSTATCDSAGSALRRRRCIRPRAR